MSSQIANVFRDKSVFITGGTGFVGQVLIEKLLRSCGEVNNIYVLIRSKKGLDAKTRLLNLLKAPIFEKCLESNPNSLNKVIAVEGDITLPGLGISDHLLKTLVRDVSIVFHSAATVMFDRPLKNVIDINVLGTRRMIALCRQLPKLESLIYVSTAYSNANRLDIEEKVYPSPTSPQNIINLCKWMSDEMINGITPKLISGFPNTYIYSKALAENLLKEEGKGLPIAIIRPSIVTASWKEPFQGCLEGIVHMTFLELLISKGIIRHLLYKKGIPSHIIPVDIVVNLMIAMVWYTTTNNRNDIQVFNCVGDTSHTPNWGEVMEFRKYFGEYPSCQVYRYPSLNKTESKLLYKTFIFIDHLIPAHIFDAFMYLLGRKINMVNNYEKIHKATDSLYWAILTHFRFDNKNVTTLGQLLTPFDKSVFNVDTQTIDWSSYGLSYWLGIRKYVLKENETSLVKAKRNLTLIYWRDVFITLFFSIVLLSGIYFILLIV